MRCGSQYLTQGRREGERRGRDEERKKCVKRDEDRKGRGNGVKRNGKEKE